MPDVNNYNTIHEDVLSHFDVDRLFSDLDAVQNVALRAMSHAHNLHRSNQQLEQLAFTDELTGLPNRHALTRQLRELLGAPGNTVAVVAVVDLDRFKEVNDGWGHGVGDEALRVLANTLQGVVRQRPDSNDMAARTGGDEFMILMEVENSELSEADLDELQESLYTRIIRKLNLQLPDGSYLFMTASIGVAHFTVEDLRRNNVTIEDLHRLADGRMYMHKQKRPVRSPKTGPMPS